MTLDQPVNETVGGIPVQKKESDSDFSSKIPIMYDEVYFLHGIKIIHVIDKRDRDFVDFGIPFVTNFFAWVFKIDLHAEKIVKGHIYVSSDIPLLTKRKQFDKYQQLDLQWYIHPVINQ
jgi:hypothetical protein